MYPYKYWLMGKLIFAVENLILHNSNYYACFHISGWHTPGIYQRPLINPSIHGCFWHNSPCIWRWPVHQDHFCTGPLCGLYDVHCIWVDCIGDNAGRKVSRDMCSAYAIHQYEADVLWMKQTRMINNGENHKIRGWKSRPHIYIL